MKEFIYLSSLNIRNIKLQLIQSISFLILNIKSIEKIYYIFSNNFINKIINNNINADSFDYTNNNFNIYQELDEEYISHYVNFLKSLISRLDKLTIQFFFNYEDFCFPLLSSSLELYNYPDPMVKTTVRNIVLGLLKLNYSPLISYFCFSNCVNYFVLLPLHIKDIIIKYDQEIINYNTSNLTNYNNKTSLNNISSLHDDILTDILFFQDIFSLDIKQINFIFLNSLFNFLINPFLLESITSMNNTIISITTSLNIISMLIYYIKNENFLNCFFIILFSYKLTSELINCKYNYFKFDKYTYEKYDIDKYKYLLIANKYFNDINNNNKNNNSYVKNEFNNNDNSLLININNNSYSVSINSSNNLLFNQIDIRSNVRSSIFKFLLDINDKKTDVKYVDNKFSEYLETLNDSNIIDLKDYNLTNLNIFIQNILGANLIKSYFDKFSLSTLNVFNEFFDINNQLYSEVFFIKILKLLFYLKYNKFTNIKYSSSINFTANENQSLIDNDVRSSIISFLTSKDDILLLIVNVILYIFNNKNISKRILSLSGLASCDKHEVNAYNENIILDNIINTLDKEEVNNCDNNLSSNKTLNNFETDFENILYSANLVNDLSNSPIDISLSKYIDIYFENMLKIIKNNNMSRITNNLTDLLSNKFLINFLDEFIQISYDEVLVEIFLNVRNIYIIINL